MAVEADLAKLWHSFIDRNWLFFIQKWNVGEGLSQSIGRRFDPYTAHQITFVHRTNALGFGRVFASRTGGTHWPRLPGQALNPLRPLRSSRDVFHEDAP